MTSPKKILVELGLSLWCVVIDLAVCVKRLVVCHASFGYNNHTFFSYVLDKVMGRISVSVTDSMEGPEVSSHPLSLPRLARIRQRRPARLRRGDQ